MVNKKLVIILDKLKYIFDSEHIEPSHLYFSLRTGGFLELNDIRNIESAYTHTQQINKLFDILKTKSDNVLEAINYAAIHYEWNKVSFLIKRELEKINSANLSPVDLETQAMDSIEHSYFGSREHTGKPSVAESSSSYFSRGKRRLSTIWQQLPLLGEGTFGTVRLYQDENTNLQFAVKRVLIKSKLSNPTNSQEIETLNKEIALLKSMHHERIVKYIGFQITDDFVYIFMEYMLGGSIKDEINSKGRLPESQMLHYTKQILEGLCYLHDRNVVHRDLKNANVLRDPCGNVKITDFGESKRLETIAGKSLHSNTISVGTYYFMAPEVINSGDYGRKADMWSLGCSVVEMLTGRPPWGHLTALQAMYKTGNGENPNYDLPTGISLTVQEFLKAVFSHDPANRPTAEEALFRKSLF